MYRPQSYSFKHENSLTHQRSICSLPSVEPVIEQPTLVFYLAYRFETSSGMSGRQTLKTKPVIHRWPTSPFFSEYESPDFLVVCSWIERHALSISGKLHSEATLFSRRGVKKKASQPKESQERNHRIWQCASVCPCLWSFMQMFFFTSFSMTHDPFVKRCARFICV